MMIPRLQNKIEEQKKNHEADNEGAYPSTLYPTPSELSSAMSSTTRWSTTYSSKVNSLDTINFRALCGAHLVT